MRCLAITDEVVRRIGRRLTLFKHRGLAKLSMIAVLEAKTDFYAELIGGCRICLSNGCLKPLHDRITLLRITSMSQPNASTRLARGDRDLRAIESGDEDLVDTAASIMRRPLPSPRSMIERRWPRRRVPGSACGFCRAGARDKKARRWSS